MDSKENIDGSIALKILKYVGLVPIILLFAVLITIIPFMMSIDNTMSQNVSSDVYLIAFEESVKGQHDVLGYAVSVCRTTEDFTFGNYMVPCDVVRSESWSVIADYLVETYPQTYYDLVPVELLDFDISGAMNSMVWPVIFVLIAISLILIILFAKGKLSSSFNYLSLGLLTGGIIYIVASLFILNYISSVGLPDFVLSLIPDFLPPMFLGYVYIGLSIFVKLIEVIIHMLSK